MAPVSIKNCGKSMLLSLVFMLLITIRGFPASGTVQETSVASLASLTDERIEVMEDNKRTDELKELSYNCQNNSRGKQFYYINGCARCDDTSINEGVKWPDCSVYETRKYALNQKIDDGKNSEDVAPVNNASGFDLGTLAFALELVDILVRLCCFCYRKCSSSSSSSSSSKKTTGPSASEDKTDNNRTRFIKGQN